MSMDYKEFLIPKKNKKFRKICEPNKELLVYQQKVLKKLYSLYFSYIKDTNIRHTAHGFIKGRNVITAAEKHIGFKNTTMLDISDFLMMLKEICFLNSIIMTYWIINYSIKMIILHKVLLQVL